MKFIVTYYHRHGHDLFFVEADDYPTEEQMEKTFPETLWELDREDEYITASQVTDVTFTKLVTS